MKPSKFNSRRKQKKSRRAPLLIIGLVVLASIVGGVLFLHSRPEKLTNGAVNERQQANAKKETAVKQNSSPVDKGDTSSGYTPPVTNDGIKVVAQRSQEQIVITTQLEGYSDGSCTLNIENNGKKYTQTAQVIYAPTFSSCAGFSVPIDSLGNGKWNITLDISSGGLSTSRTISYEV